MENGTWGRCGKLQTAAKNTCLLRAHSPAPRKYKEAKLREDPSWTLEKELAERRGVSPGVCWAGLERVLGLLW